MSRRKIYDKVIQELMWNDKNGSYDEILKDYNGNLDRAIEELKEILERLTIEDDDYEFYENLLNQVA